MPERALSLLPNKFPTPMLIRLTITIEDQVMFISELLKAKLAKGEKKTEAIFFHFAINRERQGRD